MSIAARPSRRLWGLLALVLALAQSGCGEDEVPPAPDAGMTPLPDIPVLTAPPLDPTIATNLADSSEFLYTGDHPVQVGVAKGAIVKAQVAVLRGAVRSRDGSPLPGVKVSVLAHPEFGSTLTRQDGLFDLAVNGGGLLTVSYAKDGYLAAQRQVRTPWLDFAWLPELVMIPHDAQVTAIDLAASETQAARGSPMTDKSGTRQATLLFQPGTQAVMTVASSTQPLTTLHVRATEYTVGDDGPRAMPASLPAQSGYTYAVELSVDEAEQAGAQRVEFSKPVVFYLENFLGFPAGGAVPVGYYDRERGVWVPSDNGRVINVLGITGGMADLDTDGDGKADDAATLAKLEISEGERRRLATLYQPGQGLWRVAVTHFSPWDCNWPYGPPDGATPPNQTPGGQRSDDHPDVECGSIIECQSQTLGEAVPISGTPFSLHYRSDRVRGRADAYTLRIPLSGRDLPASLSRIDLEVGIAGQRFSKSFTATPDQHYDFTWDGKDVYGRSVTGGQLATVRIGYVYSAVYRTPAQLERSFAAYGEGLIITRDRDRGEVTLWQEWQSKLGSWGNQTAALGGFGLSAHHGYSATLRTLYLGDGRRRGAAGSAQVEANQSIMITTVAGVYGQFGDGGDGGLATETKLGGISGLAVGADGSIFIADWVAGSSRIRRVGPDGVITTLLRKMDSELMTIARGPDGSLYFNESTTIRRLGPDGSLTTVAGNGIRAFAGDGGPAVQASLYDVSSIAVGTDGSLFFGDRHFRVRRVGPDGIITTIAGDGTYPVEFGEPDGDGGPARRARFQGPFGVTGLAVGPDGSLFVVDSWYGNFAARIRRIGTDGIITTVVGKNVRDISGDGGPATQAGLGLSGVIAVAPDGSLFFGGIGRVRRVGPDGIITTVAGDDTETYRGEGGPALQSGIGKPVSIAVGPDGNVFLTYHSFANGSYLICRLSPAQPGYSFSDGFQLPAEDGSEVYFFDHSGRHLRTHDALTGALRLQFGYDPAGRLKTVTDGDGNVTTVERDGQGNPTAIIAPQGQRTALAVNGDGYLQKATNPAGESVAFTYHDQGGLLATFTDARGGVHRFEYDALGRLKKDTDPAGGFKALARTDQAGGHSVAVSTAEGRTTTYQIDYLSDGGEKRVNTSPSGLPTLIQSSAAGTRQTTAPDGTITTWIQSADPRFGALAPLDQSITVKTPGGLTLTQTTTRSVVQKTADPLSLLSLTDTTTVNGRVFTSVYDRAAATIKSTSPQGRQRTAKLDDKGRVSEIQVPGLETLKYGYDARGRIVGIAQGARGYVLAYDAMGELASVKDPLSRVRTFQRDAAGRVVKETMPDGRAVQLAYDAGGNVRAITPPGRAEHGLSYTPVDLLMAYSPPDVTGAGARLTRYSYNKDRQLTQVSRPDGQVIDLGYDGAGRPRDVTIPGGKLSFAYHATTGTLTTLTALDGGTITYGYDGGLLTTATWAGTVAGSVGRTYDNDLRVSAESVNGSSISLSYDQDGLLTGAGALTLSRDAQNGRITGTSLGQVSDTPSYDSYGDLAGYQAAYAAASRLSIQYVRDDLGRITRKTETILGATSTYEYGYDTASRLAQVTKDGAVTSQYSYDENGNRTRLTRGGVDTNGTYDAQDRLSQYGTRTYSYTANGELQQKTDGGNRTTYAYDVLGNLTAATLPNGTRVEYVVDGRSRRIGKKVNGARVQGLLYGSQLRPVAELDGMNNVVSRFVYASRSNAPDYLIKGGATYRIVSDHLGSPRLVIDVATGNVAQRVDYDEFGNVTLDTAPGFQPFGFAGGLYDQHTRLVRFGARDYDAETGRWTAKDPIQFDGGDTNLYGYVLGDPINHIDPSGMFFPVLAALAGAGAADAAVAAAAAAAIDTTVGIGLGLLAAATLDIVLSTTIKPPVNPPPSPPRKGGDKPPGGGGSGKPPGGGSGKPPGGGGGGGGGGQCPRIEPDTFTRDPFPWRTPKQGGGQTKPPAGPKTGSVTTE